MCTQAFCRSIDFFFFISQPLKAETNITNEAQLHKEGTQKGKHNQIGSACVQVGREVCARAIESGRVSPRVAQFLFIVFRLSPSFGCRG